MSKPPTTLPLHQHGWEFWIDRGGTFTDLVAADPQGQIVVKKLLSDSPGQYADAASAGIRECLGLPPNAPIPSQTVRSIKMGTTVGTNALLERKGEPTALAVTAGFKDLLRIGYQNRPDIFALNIELPEMLYDHVLEIEERMSANGDVVTPLCIERTRQDLQSAYERGFRSLAILLLHSYRYPSHEQQVADLAQAVGFTHISVSSQLAPLVKAVSRGDTCVVDAYLTPVLKRYINQVRGSLDTSSSSPTDLMFMQSHGGLAAADRFSGKDSILSGPAGGIIGAVEVSQAAGFDRIITFDMGGTSTDVALYDGKLERSFQNEINGVRLRTPMLNIHTVAAGGGSICTFDGMRLSVGPESAGAIPGPACYRRGGPLTVTDCNLYLGRIVPDFFPATFGQDNSQPIDAKIVEHKLEDICKQIARDTGTLQTSSQVAQGFLTIAVDNMAQAIKHISVQRGYNVRDYTLTCFGGAGGQHACKVADCLGIDQIYLHPLAGVLSAYGMGVAQQRIVREKALEEQFTPSLCTSLPDIYASLKEDCVSASGNSVASADIQVNYGLLLRYQGTSTPILVANDSYETTLQEFYATHESLFGFNYDEKKVVAEAAVLEMIIEHSRANGRHPQRKVGSGTPPTPIATTRLLIGDQFADCPVYDLPSLGTTSITGPAIVIESTSTIVVDPGWLAEVGPTQDIILHRVEAREDKVAIGTQVDPVMLEVFSNRFMSIAETMGYSLQKTASSINIRERLDFSCAVFDAHGDLIANAPHIPVHLGALSDCIKHLLSSRGGDMRKGDAFLVNSPYHGGTHLPDLTVISPIYDATGSERRFFVASRGHHADIGGVTPGSIPSHSSSIDQEGILIRDFLLVRDGRFHEDSLRNLLCRADFPVRNVDENLADLRAQLAANEKGIQELKRLVTVYGNNVVQAYMRHVKANAEETIRRTILKLSSGQFCYEMDNGATISTTVSIDYERREANIDFTGTSAQQDNNFNAPIAVTNSVVMYVFRTLTQSSIPLNSGCLVPLKINIPEGCLLKPRFPAAVVAGNVETSQYIADSLFAAVGSLAGSQGTMNNLTFGTNEFQYYETICGGAGAGPGHDGTDAVHTHMTNSRITDPEILELRFPVRLEQFSIRSGSGGNGRFKGGNGVTRSIRFLQEMQVTILSGHRKIPPVGLSGGSPGKCGHNYLILPNQQVQELPGCASMTVPRGGVLIIETPGGGGYGKETSPN